MVRFSFAWGNAGGIPVHETVQRHLWHVNPGQTTRIIGGDATSMSQKPSTGVLGDMSKPM